ncbi:PTS sugar transporter subunit IIA [Citrobacter sp. JGM124]|uniref:PTS sugar transporter subunit IIA n=1 Tax=Citrobacter sp. JGM124 TaxID=2799789 RepID=UPI001BA72CBF|nr:PTS sugar transporter subunit IIA [Citrobacter sp. JGM124]MBS0848507.1 PTS sugar transporter subunit IIA [Citrobacter sp. JGM124]
MLGWIIAGHDFYARDMLEALEKRLGVQPQCCAVNFEKGLSTNMLARMMCDALHACDSGDGVIFLTDITGEAPYRAAALLSNKHDFCEVISGTSLSLLCIMSEYRTTLSSSTFREHIVTAGGEGVTSLWHQQQKNPPFVLIERTGW